MGSKDKKHKCTCEKDSCKGNCLCDFLKKSIGDQISITTKTGDIINGEVIFVKGCCLKIFELGSISPFIPNRFTFIDCQDIESFSVELGSSSSI